MKMQATIHTERCYLRKTTSNDLDSLIPLFTDSTVRKHLGGPISVEQAKKRIIQYSQLKKVPFFWSVYYTVVLKENQKVIGLISLTPHHNFFRKEVSYQFIPSTWGNGYAYESINGLLVHIKATGQLKNVVAETQSKNTKSCQLLEKLGFTEIDRLTRFNEEQVLYYKK